MPYFIATGLTDYRLDGQTNELSRITIDYYTANIKGELRAPLNTKITVVAAYNQSNAHSNADGEFSPVDFFVNGSVGWSTKYLGFIPYTHLLAMINPENLPVRLAQIDLSNAPERTRW